MTISPFCQVHKIYICAYIFFYLLINFFLECMLWDPRSAFYAKSRKNAKIGVCLELNLGNINMG